LYRPFYGGFLLFVGKLVALQAQLQHFAAAFFAGRFAGRLFGRSANGHGFLFLNLLFFAFHG
jgi:hypothetical protein